MKNAITITRRFKAELIIISVYELYYSGLLRIKHDWDEENENIRSEHLRNFNSFLEDFNLIDLNWDKEIQSGDPATEILGAISRHKSDLLIMGTTGKSGLSRLIMGSVTEKVIREVPCSFITLKSKDIIDLQLEAEIRDIESHCILTPSAETIIKKAFNKLNLSMRGYHKILKVSRTIADLAQSERIDSVHMQEAIMYRSLDHYLEQ